MMEEDDQARMASLKKIVFLRLLDNKARERLNNIRLVNPMFAERLEELLLMYIQKTGGKKIDEETLVKIAKSARGDRADGSIRRV